MKKPNLAIGLEDIAADQKRAKHMANFYTLFAAVLVVSVAIAGQPDDLGSFSFVVLAGCLIVAREVALLRTRL